MKPFKFSDSKHQKDIGTFLLNDREITNYTFREITDDILKLDFVDQLHIYLYIIDSLSININKKTICDFLMQFCFNKHREVIKVCCGSNRIHTNKIKELEKTHNIEITLC